MSKPLPKWLMERYSILWKRFNEKEFDHDESVQILKEEKERLVSVVLSELKKHGWLTVKLHPEDSRKRIYKLKNPEDAINEIEHT
ncbi:MAG: hypothetical protein DRN27_07600 [Thermoplasmata archaeon]|nr:MAG: hypothetical protein DRN27_07600 [Thermoplasmata archaeon]